MRKDYGTGRGGKTGSKDKKSAGGRAGQKIWAHTGKSEVGPKATEKLEIPEGSVRLIEGEADVPRFMIAPNDLRFGLASSLWMDEFDALI